MAPGHNVNFRADGLPDGVSFTITGYRYNNGGHYGDYSITFTTPNLSAGVGADAYSEFTYSGFPDNLMVGMEYFERVSLSHPSPFTTGAPGGETTVVATYETRCLPPTITVEPGGQTVQYGDPVTFSVTAVGSPELTYAWYKVGSSDPIAGADQASYTIPSVSMGDAGSYYAVVTNACGSDTSASAQLTVTKANQLITFDQPASPVGYNTSFTVAPTASSGLPVTLVATGVCSNVGYEVTMESGTGVCALTASQPGDDNYFPAPDVVRTIDATRASQTIDFPAPPSPAAYGTSFTIEATATSGLPVSFQVAGVCSLNGNEVTMTSGTGTCTIIALQAGNGNYESAPIVQHRVDAVWATQTIDFPAPPSPAVYGASFTLSATASSGLPISYQVTGVCSLDGNEVTMTSGTGACTITASQPGNDYYAPAPDVERSVDAARADQSIDFPLPPSPAVYGTSFLLQATASSGLAVSYNVSGVCSLDGNEVTMTAGTGTCTVTVSQSGNGNYNPAPGVDRAVVAARADQAIDFPELSSPTLYGSSFNLDASSSSGLPVSFQVEGVCSLAGTVVTMTSGTGTCTVTAIQEGDANYNPAPGVARVVVAARADQTLDFPVLSSPVAYGTSFAVDATASSGLPVSFEVLGVCSLSGTEVTMTSGWGICTVTAKQSGNDNFNPAPDVLRQVRAAKASQTITFAQPPSPVKYRTSFAVSPSSSSGLPVALASSGSCTSEGYTVTMTETSGECLLAASQAGDLNYLPAESVQHSVMPAPNGNVIFLPLLLELLQ